MATIGDIVKSFGYSYERWFELSMQIIESKDNQEIFIKKLWIDYYSDPISKLKPRIIWYNGMEKEYKFNRCDVVVMKMNLGN